MIYKCKLCGGQLDIKQGDKLTTCPYCGSIQTIPNLDDEKINRLFERGNELIRNCQFDDAINKFEEILLLRNDDPEIYWSLLMAKFGVIYEKDPYTGNMIPTIHRNQDISVFLDEDYKLTLQYADNVQLDYYNKQAKIIDNIQKKYNAISDQEDSFDVFICYKQSDDNTKQDTEDYKIAYDLYNSLSKEGYKVFFSHVTLEDKMGEEFEPYIYAALKSAKVLLAIGTKQEYYNAIWVKNEWSRFMFMMKNDHSKRLIPICTNISILPIEFNKYQAVQTNNNFVWKEDLIRNINKILHTKSNSTTKDEIKATEKQSEDNNSVNKKNKKRKTLIISFVIAILFVVGFVFVYSNKSSTSFNLNTKEKTFNTNYYELIGMLNGSIYYDMVKESFPDSKIVLYSTESDMMLGLKEEQIECYITDYPIALINVTNDNDIKILEDSNLGYVEFGTIFSDLKKDVLAEYNEFLKKSKNDGFISYLEDKWLDGKGDTKRNDKYEYSGEKGILRAITSPDCIPFSFFADNEYQGYDLDLFYKFCHDYGYTPYLECTTFDSIIASVTSGKHDISFCGIAKTEERKKSVLFSDPTYLCDIVIVVRNEDVLQK